MTALTRILAAFKVLFTDLAPEQLDVWEMHHRVMAASAQKAPLCPTMTHGFVLYLALTAEELAETFDAAIKSIMESKAVSFADDHDMAELTNTMIEARDEMQSRARLMRIRLSRIQPRAINWPLSRAEAAELLDGISDVMVTTAGMSLSAGLPGAAAYVEVQTANWSKANPSTGRIDKDSSGKWIKGVNYQPPNLEAVLQAQAMLEGTSPLDDHLYFGPRVY